MFQFADVHRAASVRLSVQRRFRALRHGLLDDVCDFLGGLREHFVHILRHGVRIAQVL